MKSVLAFLCLLSLALSEPIPQQPPPKILRTLQLPPLPSPEDRSLSSDRATLLNDHNAYRRAHSVPELQMDSELENTAQKYADYLARTGVWDHSVQGTQYRGSDVGENLYEGGDATEASKLWYCEVDDYKKNPNVWTNEPMIGHFTQLVWKASQKVGFGIATASNGQTYVVAQYWPQGNFNFNSGGAQANVINYQSATCEGSNSGGGSACSDLDSGCGGWTSYCNNHDYKSWMEENCKQTCGHCGGGSSTSCSDLDSGCGGWTSYCNNHVYKSWMEENCKQTCGHC